MGRTAFVSDFDGTMSFRDFYHIVIDKYMGDEGRKLYAEWKSTRKINVDFLNIIFGSMHVTQDALIHEILQIPFDESARDLIQRVNGNGWDFYIVSAGTSYYIEILLEHLGIRDVHLISMKGIYDKGGIRILPDPQSPYYHDVFGMDKGKVIASLRQSYETIFFAGDSEPDLTAAKAADIRFARNELAQLLDKENADYVAYGSFADIQKHLMEKGWLK